MPAGGVVGARKPGVRLSETDGTFAWVYLRRIETCGAFARAGRAATETAIAFAGEKWVFSCVFWLQRCRRFQRLLFRGEQW